MGVARLYSVLPPGLLGKDPKQENRGEGKKGNKGVSNGIEEMEGRKGNEEREQGKCCGRKQSKGREMGLGIEIGDGDGDSQRGSDEEKGDFAPLYSSNFPIHAAKFGWDAGQSRK